MAEYRGTVGSKVRNYTTDPDNPIEGQVWYNTTDNVLKFQYPNLLSSWRTGNALSVARSESASTSLSRDAALYVSGRGGPSAILNNTESYDGTSWTEVNDLNTGRRLITGSGNNTAMIAFGGSSPPPVSAYANNESWNGSTWTEVGDLNTARWALQGQGTSTAGLGFGGSPGSGVTGATESWNGTTWTETGDLNTARQLLGGAGQTNTAVLAYGGAPPNTAVTENFNGTSWTEVNDLNVARFKGGSSGVSNASSIAFGGNAGTPVTTATEEWDANQPVGAWSTTNTMNTMRVSGQAGVQTDAIVFGGDNPGGGSYNLTEAYNGTSWTNLPATLNSARSSSGGTGTSTSALMFGGYDNGGPLAPSGYLALTESYNGSAWTEVADLNDGRQILGSAGASNTSALAFGGLSPGYSTNTETWNGTSWTEVNNLNTGRYSQGDGTQTSAINVAGYNGSNIGNVETWNGTSWTEVANVNTTRRGLGVAGSDNTSVLAYAGFSTAQIANTEDWNGVSWVEVADVNTAGGGNSGNIGSASSTLRVSTGAPNVEEWSGSSISTRTVSTD